MVKSKSSKKKTTKKVAGNVTRMTKIKLVMFGVAFGVVGVLFINLAFANTDEYTYKQELAPSKLSQVYGFTMNPGPFKAEVTTTRPMQLSLTDSSGKVIATSASGTTISLSTQIPAKGKYDFRVSGKASDISATTKYTLTITNKDVADVKRKQYPDGVNSFPDESNTGWQHTGIALSPSGGITASKEGQVIDGKDINGCVLVKAKNVVIKRSRIRCGSTYGVEVRSGNAIIEDTEIIGTSSSCGQGVGFQNYKLLRVNIYGCLDGIKAQSNVTVELSYIHDQRKAAESHNDAVQTRAGSNIVFRRNRIEGPYNASTSAFIISSAAGKIDNMTIENNYLSGGGYMIYVIDKDAGFGPPTNVTIRDNTVEANSMTHSWITYDVAPTMSGNKWHTGELIKGGEKRGPGS